jgi:hypothetical protein
MPRHIEHGGLFVYPDSGGQRRRSPPQGADKEDGMERWVSWLKIFGVSVLLTISLLSPGNPAFSATDSAPSLLIRPSSLHLNMKSGARYVLETNACAGGDKTALSNSLIDMTGLRIQQVGQQITKIHNPGSIRIIDLLADSNAPGPRVASFSRERLSESEDSQHE